MVLTSDEYKKNPSRTITGSYDKKGLPEDFADFAETVFDVIRFYGLGGILDLSVYGRVKCRKSEYIFCSVTFIALSVFVANLFKI